MLLVGEVTPGEGAGQSLGRGGGPSTMKPGQLRASEREALGILQVVRVQFELALGS